MATGFYTGRTGSLIVGDATETKPIAKIRDWSIETTVELLSTNTIDSHANTFTPGVKGATGSATLMYYRLSDTEKTANMEFTKLLEKVLNNRAITTADRVTLQLNVGGDVKDDIIFKAYITSATVSVSTGELSVVPINFTVDGDFEEFINASSGT